MASQLETNAGVAVRSGNGLSEFATFRVIGRSAWSLIDQILFSGSMFVLNILLARWTTAADFGAFVVLFAIFLIVAGVHNALVVEPMTVYGARKARRNVNHYLHKVFMLHLAVVAPLTVVAVIIALFLDQGSLADSRWALPLATPLVLTFWLNRRTCYVVGKPRQAAILSAIYATLVLTGAAILQASDFLDTFSAVVLLGVAGLIASIFGAIQFLSEPFFVRVSTIAATFREHWKYGRWAVAESLTFMLGTGAYPLLIAWFGGLHETGQFRALQILFLPLAQILIGLGLPLLPWLSRSNALTTASEFQTRSWLVIALFLGASLCYSLPILGLEEFIVTMLYGDNEYIEMTWIIPHLIVVAILGAVSSALMLVLRSAERPDLIFVATAASCATTLTVGIALIVTSGLQGFGIAIVATALVNTVTLMMCLRILTRSLKSPSTKLVED